MNIDEIKVGLRVRVPATEKNGGGGNHYAYVQEIGEQLFGEVAVMVHIPALSQDKVLHPDTILPARATRKQAGAVESPAK